MDFTEKMRKNWLGTHCAGKISTWRFQCTHTYQKKKKKVKEFFMWKHQSICCERFKKKRIFSPFLRILMIKFEAGREVCIFTTLRIFVMWKNKEKLLRKFLTCKYELIQRCLRNQTRACVTNFREISLTSE